MDGNQLRLSSRLAFKDKRDYASLDKLGIDVEVKKNQSQNHKQNYSRRKSDRHSKTGYRKPLERSGSHVKAVPRKSLEKSTKSPAKSEKTLEKVDFASIDSGTQSVCHIVKTLACPSGKSIICQPSSINEVFGHVAAEVSPQLVSTLGEQFRAELRRLVSDSDLELQHSAGFVVMHGSWQAVAEARDSLQKFVTEGEKDDQPSNHGDEEEDAETGHEVSGEIHDAQQEDTESRNKISPLSSPNNSPIKQEINNEDNSVSNTETSLDNIRNRQTYHSEDNPVVNSPVPCPGPDGILARQTDNNDTVSVSDNNDSECTKQQEQDEKDCDNLVESKSPKLGKSSPPPRIGRKRRMRGVGRIAQSHPERASHTCDVCGFMSSREGVNKHRRRLHATAPSYCDICRLEFGVRYDMRRHRLTHFDSSGNLHSQEVDYLKVFKPELMGITLQDLETNFVSPSSKDRKTEGHDPELTSRDGKTPQQDEPTTDKEDTGPVISTDKDNETEACQTKSKGECAADADAGVNIKQETDPNAKLDGCCLKDKSLKGPKRLPRESYTHTCPYCDRVFHHRGGYILHLQKHEPKKSFQCEKCDFVANRKGLLRMHEKTQHDSPVCVCEECGKLFSSHPSLKFHVNTVHGSDTYTCTECGKIFAAMRFLRVHEKRVHKRERKYCCQTCGRGFFEKGKLKEHEHSHGSETEKDLQKKFTCTHCGKRFLRKYTLSQHENIHTGHKPFKCEICGKGFSFYAERHKHMAAHSDARPHKCPHCHKAFKFLYKLTAHIVVHTKQGKHRCTSCGKVYTALSSLRKHVCKARMRAEPIKSSFVFPKNMTVMCQVCGQLVTEQTISTHVCPPQPADDLKPLIILDQDASELPADVIVKMISDDTFCEDGSVMTLAEIEDDTAANLLQHLGQNTHVTTQNIDIQPVNGNQDVMYMCGICEQVFPSQDLVNDHIAQH